MGNEQSGLGEKFGFHVIKVSPDGPGAKAGLVPYFDFVVLADGKRLSTDDATFVEIIKSHKDKPLVLQVFDARTMTVREVIIEPTDKWPGEGLLGVTIRFASFEKAFRHGAHVLDVFKDSPSDHAGLQPREDHIVGTPSSLFHDDSEFYWLLEKYEKKPLTLLVYNGKSQTLREVTITPNSDWGGNGSLGCELGQGWLHELPGFAPADTEVRVLSTTRVNLPTEPAVPPFGGSEALTSPTTPATATATATAAAAAAAPPQPAATQAVATVPAAASPGVDATTAALSTVQLSSTPAHNPTSPVTPAGPALATKNPAPEPAAAAAAAAVAATVAAVTPAAADVVTDAAVPGDGSGAGSSLPPATPTPVYPPGTEPKPVLPPE